MLSPELRKAVELSFGRPILFPTDCIELSEMIFLKTQKRISSQTLRRVFGFLVDGTRYGSHTQRILEQFGSFTLDGNDLHFTHKLIYDLLTMTEPLEDDFGYQVAIGKVAEFLFRSPRLLEVLFPQLLKNKSARIFLVERNPWIDGIATNFILPLKCYLTLEERNKEGKIFAYSLLHFGAFLSLNDTNENVYFERLNSISKLPLNLHPFPKSRWYRSQLFHYYSMDQPLELNKVRNTMIQLCLDELCNFTSPFPYFTYIALEGFCLLNSFEGLEDILILLEKKKWDKKNLIENGYWISFFILQCIVTKGLGFKINRTKLKNIPISQLHFTHIQLYQLLFYTHFPEETNQESKDKLIRETGFVWFDGKSY